MRNGPIRRWREWESARVETWFPWQGSPPPFIIPKKTEKNFQINKEPHINTMPYIRETYIECVYVPSRLNIFYNHFAPYTCWHIIYFNDYYLSSRANVGNKDLEIITNV